MTENIVVGILAVSAIAGVILYTRWRTGSIYVETQEQYELNLGD